MLASNGHDDELRASQPLVTPQHIRIARAYAERFPDEVEAFVREQHRPLDELRALYPLLKVG